MTNQNKNYSGMQKKAADKIASAYQTDERISRVNETGLAACGVVAIIYVVARIIYIGFKGEIALAELVLLALMGIALGITNSKNKVYTIPTFFGKQLDISQNSHGLINRMKWYLAEAAFFATTWSALDIFLEVTEFTKSVVMDTVINFGITLIVVFVLDLIIYEPKVKKYNNYLSQLEEDENNLED